MVRDSTRDLVELATSPLSALKNAVSVIINSVQDVLERMNEELKGIVKVISEIGKEINHLQDI
jgi:archaellum component FlaC